MKTRNHIVMRQMTAAGVALAGAALLVSTVESVPVIIPPASDFQHSAAAPEAAIWPAGESSVPEPEEKKPPRRVPKPVTVEPRTPEEAAEQAADRKAPSGALIIKSPEDTGATANRTEPSPLPPSAPRR